MSFPHSRSNITTYNPYNIRVPTFSRKPSNNLLFDPYDRNGPRPGHITIVHLIPLHNAYTSLPAELNKKGYHSVPMSQNISDIYEGTQFAKESLIRNKAMSNPYNTYPFYDDPSVMWMPPAYSN